ncbi:substrate-binding domain-containing protein [Heliobacterium gestii]|uniref:Substrate-binding domain-containing protein n=1 Tax=Heliomicrobium gestii TaxID=2699 RepID=A0A845LIR5_HELGE|nr:LacI family DNA-binding transcriptional regulator [Heliomicrobium gestii]MBM7868029.1 LacI family transcriptional regulator [Heliomicrobium gestii]MZP44295.1 substrate-binding domain-containing protein [Heliomicrobium gestii]
MATIKDVAALAGVSVSTVSRVINASGYVDSKTGERVLAAVEALDYRPSRIARTLVTRRSGTIGLILPDITNPFFPEVARGAEDEAYRHGYNLILCNSDWKLEKETLYLGILRQQCVEGVILVSTKLTEERLTEECRSLPPLVVIDRTITLDIHSISSNNVGGAALATKHLLVQGYRRIAHIAGPASSISARQRLEGYHRTMAEAGLPVDPALVVEGDYRLGGGKKAMARLLALTEPPEAVFCANDMMAVGALEQLQESDRCAPADMAVVGYDGIDLTRYVHPRLTTVIQPTYQMGERAVQLLLETIKGNESFQHIELEPRLAIGDSSVRRDGP